MAEGEGFEPPVACATLDFESSTLNQALPPLRVEVENAEVWKLQSLVSKFKLVAGEGLEPPTDGL